MTAPLGWNSNLNTDLNCNYKLNSYPLGECIGSSKKKKDFANIAIFFQFARNLFLLDPPQMP